MNNMMSYAPSLPQYFFPVVGERLLPPFTSRLKIIFAISSIAVVIFSAYCLLRYYCPVLFPSLMKPSMQVFASYGQWAKNSTPITDSPIAHNLNLDLSSINKYYEKYQHNINLLDQFQINDNMECVHKSSKIDTLPRLIEGIKKISFDDKSDDFFSTFDIRQGIMRAFSLASIVALKRLHAGDLKAGKMLDDLKTISLPHSTPQEVIDTLDQFIKIKLNNTKKTISLNKKTTEYSQDPLEKQQQIERKQALKKSGIKHVAHSTKINNIINMLKLQKIIPSAPLFIPGIATSVGGISMHGNNDVFTTVLPKLTSDEYKNIDKRLFEYIFNLKRFSEHVILIFRRKALIKCDFHFSIKQNYGGKSKDRFLDANEIDQLVSRIGNGKGSNLLTNNELVIHHSIDLDDLKEIWVSSDEKKKELIALLKKNKIAFEGDPAFSCIKPMTNFPQSLYQISKIKS